MKITFQLLALITLGLLSGISNAQQSYSNVIAFGDSLSDTGNLASVTIDFPFPFFDNRVSDGPVALDMLAESIGYSAAASLHLTGNPSGYNYSVAGGNIVGNDVEDLEPQVSAHLNRVNNATDSQALYVLIMGGNDIRGTRSIESDSVANAEIELIVDQLISQLARLSEAGAQHFFIANVPNVGRIPQTLELGATVSARAELYSQIYNTLLETRLTSFSQQTGVNIKLFDIFASLENILNNASDFGFSFTDIGCFDFDNLAFHPGCLFGLAFNRFVFFDSLHPTNATNQIVAQAMIEKLNEPEPEPQPDRTIFPIGVIMLLLED